MGNSKFKTISILSEEGEYINFTDKDKNIILKLTVVKDRKLTYTKVEILENENNISYTTLLT